MLRAYQQVAKILLKLGSSRILRFSFIRLLGKIHYKENEDRMGRLLVSIITLKFSETQVFF